jgi:predicted nucleic acid-binding protein
MWAEVTSALRRASRSGRITAEDAAQAVLDLIRLPINMLTDLSVHPRALDLASRLDLGNAYDMQYVAAADLQGALLMTLDRGLYQLASQVGIPARLIA